MKRTSLSRGTKTLKRSGFQNRTKGLKLTSKGVKPKKVGKVPKKKKSLAKWKKELDAVFSRYIRQRDGGQCFTCPKKDHWKFMQNGHFVPRQYLSLRFDEKNCNCQCYACNMLYNGQPSLYAVNLKKRYGDSIIEELESVRLKETKLDADWYVDKIKHYQSLLVE